MAKEKSNNTKKTSQKKETKKTTTTSKATTKSNSTKKTTTKKIVEKKHGEKKAELIKKLATQAEKHQPSFQNTKKDSNKIPTWVWIFFGCSLLLFCISIYQAFLRPKITTPVIQPPVIQQEEIEEVIISNNENDLNSIPTIEENPAIQTIQNFY